jgi:hypothetical protein
LINGGKYKVYAYIEGADGTRIDLPASFDPQAFQTIFSLTQGLLNAHDSKRQSLSEAYEIKGLDACGLIKEDGNAVSHDFAIHPTAPTVAEPMANLLTRSGKPIEATAIKAQDIWNMLEEEVRKGMQTSNPSNPLHPITSPSPQPQSTKPPATPHHCTSPGIDLKHFNLESSDWYSQLPDSLKLRILKQTRKGIVPAGSIYAKAWYYFKDINEKERKKDSNSPAIITLLQNEIDRLESKLQNPTLKISERTRKAAESIYDLFTEGKEIQGEIDNLMLYPFSDGKEDVYKDFLFMRIREQAKREGIPIADWDDLWAQHHYKEDPRRFVEALVHWLDDY